MNLLGQSSQIDLDAVRRAVRQVRDPELHLSLGDAGMVGGIGATRSVVDIEVRLTHPSCPLREEIRARVGAAARSVPGVDRVEIEFTTLSERERMALATRLRDDQPRHRFSDPARTRVYAVASGKGGVGKSTITANVAVALAARGQKVGILDADVWGYSIPTLFGVRRAPVALKGLMLPIEAHGVSLMSVGFLVRDEPVVWRGPMLHKAIEQFIDDVHWGDLDVLLVDLPPGTGDVTISLLELLPEAQLLVVTTPQPAASAVAARVGQMARDARMPVAGVIENMTTLVCGSCGARHELFGAGGGHAVSQELGVPLLGQVPLDSELRSGGDAGTPVVVSTPGADSATELRRIATTLPVVRRGLVGRSLPLAVV